MSIWRRSTTAILVAGILVVIVASIVAFAITTFRPTVEVKMGSGVFQLWVAKDEPSRVTGLSGVEKLKPNGGLLMAFASDEEWGIWMKDMKVDLDIIWLDQDKKVVHTVKNAAAALGTDKTFVPTKPARYVVELPAGSAQKYGIKTGQTAVFEDIEGIL